MRAGLIGKDEYALYVGPEDRKIRYSKRRMARKIENSARITVVPVDREEIEARVLVSKALPNVIPSK